MASHKNPPATPITRHWPLLLLALVILLPPVAASAAAPAIWSPRFGQAATVFKDKIWVAGGDTSEEKFPTPSPFLPEESSRNDVWCTPDGTHWTRVIHYAPWQKRYGHTLTTFRGKLWVIGGRSRGRYHDDRLNDVWTSADGSSWTLVTANAPWRARFYHQTVVFKDRLWVIGGEAQEEYSEIPCGDIWSSKDGTNWQLVTKSTPWKFDESIAAGVRPMGTSSRELPQALFVIASTGRVSPNGIQMHENGFWQTVDGLNWHCMNDAIPFHGSSFAATYFDRSGLAWDVSIFGGRFEYSYSAQVWATFRGDIWGLGTCCAPWGERARMSVTAFGDSIYLMGGLRGDTLTNDVWRSEDGVKWTELKPERTPAATTARTEDVSATAKK